MAVQNHTWRIPKVAKLKVGAHLKKTVRLTCCGSDRRSSRLWLSLRLPASYLKVGCACTWVQARVSWR